MMRFIVTTIVTVLLVQTLPSAQAIPVLPLQNGFDKGAEGWTLEAQTGWFSSGGNPGGHLETFIRRFDDDYGNSAHAPAHWLGDWRALENNAVISFDYRLFDPGEAVVAYGRPSLTLTSGSIVASWASGPNITDTSQWFSYHAPIALTSDWTVVGGTWQQLLANVTDVQISFATVNNNWYPQDLNGLDNVSFTAIPEPTAACALLALAALCRRGRSTT